MIIIGTSRQRSNLQGLTSSETITGFDTISASSLVASNITAGVGFTGDVTGNVTGNITSGTSVRVDDFVKVGKRFIFSGDANTSGAIVASVASTVTTPASLPGSLYMSTDAELWLITSSTVATQLPFQS